MFIRLGVQVVCSAINETSNEFAGMNSLNVWLLIYFCNSNKLNNHKTDFYNQRSHIPEIATNRIQTNELFRWAKILVIRRVLLFTKDWFLNTTKYPCVSERHCLQVLICSIMYRDNSFHNKPPTRTKTKLNVQLSGK